MKNPIRDSFVSPMPTRPIDSAGVAWGWIITTGILLLLAALPAFSANSPTFRGNPRHSGVYDVAAVPILTGVIWAFQTAGRVISEAAIDGATVYASGTGNICASPLTSQSLKTGCLRHPR